MRVAVLGQSPTYSKKTKNDYFKTVDKNRASDRQTNRLEITCRATLGGVSQAVACLPWTGLLQAVTGPWYGQARGNGSIPLDVWYYHYISEGGHPNNGSYSPPPEYLCGAYNPLHAAWPSQRSLWGSMTGIPLTTNLRLLTWVGLTVHC